jgi:ribosomal protein S18 acetylase RimI-like enzyme
MTGGSGLLSGMTIRDATRWDIAAVAGILACTVLSTPLGKWLEPDPVARGGELRAFYLERVEDALRHGAARLIEQDDTTIAAAVWVPCTEPNPADCTAAGARDGVSLRMGQLGAAVWQPHLPEPHLRLAGLGVLLRHRRRGVATALLTEHRRGALLSAHCLAVEESLTALCVRCGYRPYGARVGLKPGEAGIQPMQRDTDLPAVVSRNLASVGYTNSRLAARTPGRPTLTHDTSGDGS